VRFVTLPGVFRPLPESRLLTDVVCAQRLAPGAPVLDLCTGSGIVAITAAARLQASVTAVDVSRRALLTTRVNARLNGVDLRALRSDLFEELGDERYALVTANPPYLPADCDELPARGPSRAWEGGRDGRALVDRIIAGLPGRLAPGGVVVLLHSALCGVAQTLAGLREHGVDAVVAARRHEPFGPLMRARAADLQRRGLIAPGQRHDELVVVRGRVRGPVRNARRPIVTRPQEATAR